MTDLQPFIRAEGWIWMLVLTELKAVSCIMHIMMFVKMFVNAYMSCKKRIICEDNKHKCMIYISNKKLTYSLMIY